MRTLPTWLPLHAPRRRTLPYEVETHSRSHSLLQSRASATVRPCAGGGDGVRNSSSGGCICEFAKCIERDRRRRASVAPYALRYSCCRHCRLHQCCFSIDLVTASSSSSFYSKLDLPYTHSVYSIQNKTEMHSAMCEFFFMMLFSLCIFLLLILSGLTSSWVGTLFGLCT